jgi:hypothetical protein
MVYLDSRRCARGLARPEQVTEVEARVILAEVIVGRQ